MPSTTETARTLVRKLGPFRGPTRSGFANFCHKACGDRKYRLGLNLRSGKLSCFNCGYRGHAEDVVGDYPQHGLRLKPQHAPRAAFSGEDPDALPWKTISENGPMTMLESKVVVYLRSRGVTRERAHSLGLGYGISAPYTGCAIHPWLRDDGSLGGWQARKTYDPDDGSPKIIHALPSKWPNLYTPAQGAMFGFDLVPMRAPILLVEGPYDTHSGQRVIPTVGIMGSEIYLAQIRRLQRKRPLVIYYGLDPDTFDPFWLEAEQRWGPPKARKNFRLLSLNFDCPIRVIEYPAGFDGDIGGRESKRPHKAKVIARLVATAGPMDPTL